jgi:hypothetical protein
MFRRTMRLWKRFWAWLRGRPSPLRLVRVEELPDALRVGEMYLVGEGDHLWFVGMLCPCGCGETLHMSLLQESRPRWRVLEHADGTASLEPSVWRQVGCRSHFFLRRGLIEWCESR